MSGHLGLALWLGFCSGVLALAWAVVIGGWR